MKKFVCLISVMLVSLMAFSQTIDKSKFKEVSLFDYLVEEKEKNTPFITKCQFLFLFNQEQIFILRMKTKILLV